MNLVYYVIFGVPFFHYWCTAQNSIPKPWINAQKIGQCPYILTTPKKCIFQCKTDYACNGTEKCCSNGCGTQCMKPVKLSMCQHQREVARYHIRQRSVDNVFQPKCEADGSFEQRQCDSFTNECWCVDFRGFEISQTRTSARNQLNCETKSYSGDCPLYRCAEDCDHGFVIDQNGCRTCECVDPCLKITCKEQGKSCRFLNVECPRWPCPSIAMCMPDPENPCTIGEPLKWSTTGNRITCSADHLCPESYVCQLTTFIEYGFCCLQPPPQTVIDTQCPKNDCQLFCRNGYTHDDNGCPMCHCHEPCKYVLCPEGSTCKIQHVVCKRAPCLPFAVCM